MAPSKRGAPDDVYAALETPRAASTGSTVKEEEDPWKADLTNPLDRANWLSQFTLWWINPAIGRGYRKLLEEDDVWELPVADKADVLQARFDKVYKETAQRHYERQAPMSAPSPPSVYRAMWYATKDKMGVAIFLHFASAAMSLLQPLLIKALLDFLRGDENMFGINSGYALAALLTIAACVAVNTLDFGMYLTARAGINARMIVVNSVYQKVLRLTSTARLSMNSGDIITLAGVDSDRLFEAYAIGMWSVVSPIVVLLACVIMGFLTSFLVALAAAVCSLCIVAFAVSNSRRIAMARRDILLVAGERVKVTNEVLQGIRVIKMYAWEKSISDRIAEIRAREVKLLRKYDYLRMVNFITLTYAQTFISAVCFVVFVYEGNTLTVPTAFALLSLASACRQPFSVFSNAVVFSSEGWTSLKRLATFLAQDEVAYDLDNSHFEPLVEGEPIIEIKGADFSWVAQSSSSSDMDEAVPRPTLRNINFSVMPGSLTIIVGAVGSGKSSLVSALLGEMEHLRGTRAVRGAIAYASQQPWIQHNTVRDNIVFGAPFDAAYYDKVIASCQLTRDLEILDDGDMTEIGERGINLSGGQKARVSLARALYRRDSDLVVLDDPLSALDVHVANAVFFECVKGLVADKTRLLVLNAHYHLLRHADRIVVLSNGEIVGDGSYEDVQAKFTFLEDHAHEKATAAADAGVVCEAIAPHQAPPEIEADQVDDDVADYADVPEAPDFFDTPETMERMSYSRVSRVSIVKSRAERNESKVEVELEEAPKKTMMLEEDRAIGSVTWRTYASFLESTGYNGVFLLVALFVVFIVAQSGLVAADYFVTYWSNGSLDQYSQKTLVWMYVGVAVGAVVLGVLRVTFFTEVCIKCSKVVHARFFNKVLYAPINTFFDVTPVGRVLNRFSRDLDQIDNPIPWYSMAGLVYVAMVLAVFVVCAVTTPTTLILYAPLLYVSNYVQNYFLNTSRELKRLDGITRTPFLNLVGETINGIDSIRSFRMANQFSQKCRDLLNYNSKFFFMFQSANKWFAMRLDWLVTTVVAVVSFTCVASRHSIGTANVGIALTYAVQLTLQFQRLLTLSSQTENYMTSFERIAYYGSLTEEGDTKQLDLVNPPPASWPTNGTIEFSNVFLRYRDGLDFVLRGVTFSVRDGEKIGVCGRTGSGKSTLMNALFRTVEAAQGVVRIDGVDIATVKLQHLRSKLTIIPQDPVLFSGSLRENLDPFNEKSDEELFSALRKVHLIDDVGRWGQGLSYEVSEKGENLSVGQRQLICIARALLRESRIVVLDEATANVDQELDRLIQVAVKECFRGRTSLTIAHRLETIADSDRILVMEQGHVAEFDTPSNLLAKRDGLFASLMQSTAKTADSE